jgi:predicted GIY-YIG superfamily endonuclease
MQPHNGNASPDFRRKSTKRKEAENMRRFNIHSVMLRQEIGVYWIMNERTGRRYYGHSVDISERIRQHLSTLRAGKHRNAELQADFDRYGEDCFQFTVKTVADKATAERIEREMIMTNPGSYNVCLNNAIHQAALEAQEREGYTLTAAARLFDIPRSTLQSYKERLEREKSPAATGDLMRI